jgi:hypothetical protein
MESQSEWARCSGKNRHRSPHIDVDDLSRLPDTLEQLFNSTSALAAMLAGSGFTRVLREAAPGLTRRFFSCQCHNARPTRPFHSARIPITQQTASFRALNRASARSFQKSFRDVFKTAKRLSSTTATLAQDIPQTTSTTKASFFPETSSDAVGYWLLASALSVFGIVIFGGLTRLTESGYGNSSYVQERQLF